MKSIYRASAAMGALLVSNAAFGQAAPTQTAAAAPGAQLETVIVTAQKRSEKLQTVPIAVTAFTKKQLEITHVTSVEDLSSTVPNFQISVGGAGPGAAVVSLRGLSFQDIEKSFEPPIGLVLDGVYLATSTGQVAQAFDFSSVEVLAGPQGTLFGKNTTGGVINITRSKPDPTADGIHGSFDLTGGNFGEHDGEAVVMIPVIKDVLAVKLAAFSQNNTGDVPDPTVGHNLGARDYQSFSLGIDYRPNVDSDVYLIFDRTTDHSGLQPLYYAGTPNKLPLSVGGFVDGGDSICENAFLVGACPNASGSSKDVSYQDGLSHAGYELYALTLNSYYNFDNFKLVNITSYRSSHEESDNDYDATQYSLYNTQRPEYYRQFTQENRYESKFDGPFNFVAGAYFFNSFYRLEEANQLDLAAVVPVLPPGYDIIYTGSYAAQDAWNESLFFQGSYNITPKLKFIFGGRQSWDQKHIDFGLSSGGTASNFGTVYSSIEKDHQWSQFTPKAGFQYTIDANAMAYLTYSKGYNSGGFNGRAGSIDVVGPYAPEQVHAFEIGTKTTWLDNRLRLNADAFYNLFNNAQEEIIVATPGGGTSTTVANAASAVFRGFELEAAGKPTPDWTLAANFGYLNAYYTGFTAALLSTEVTNNEHLTVRRAPPESLGVNSDYIIPMQTGLVGFNANLKFVGPQQLDLLNDPRGYVGAVTKIDLGLRYERKIGGIDWTLSGFVKNLTNQTPNNAFVTGYLGSFVEFWSKEIGRTYGVTLRGKF